MSKKVKFMGADVIVSKLTVQEVLDIQAIAKDVKEDDAGFDLLKKILSCAVEGADELTDDDFSKFPMDELSNLSNEIMRFSGVNKEAGK
jgi:hypothetical protein